MAEPLEQKNVCACCATVLRDAYKYCPFCGYPLVKTEVPVERPVPAVGSSLDDSLPPEVQEIRRRIRENNGLNGGKPLEGETRSAQEIVAAVRARIAARNGGQSSAGPRPDEAVANPSENLTDWRTEGASFRAWQEREKSTTLSLVPPLPDDTSSEEQPASDEQTETLDDQLDLNFDAVSDVAEKSGWSEKKFIAAIIALGIVLATLGFLGMVLYKVFIAG